MQMRLPQSPREYARAFPPMRAQNRREKKCSRLAPSNKIQIFMYSTPAPVLPSRFIFPCFTSSFRYRSAVASEQCKSFSTSSFMIFSCFSNRVIIFSNFCCFFVWIFARAFTKSSRAACGEVFDIGLDDAGCAADAAGCRGVSTSTSGTSTGSLGTGSAGSLGALASACGVGSGIGSLGATIIGSGNASLTGV